MKDKKRPIGIFDSGLGGLTVFKAIRKLMPQENLIYFGDTARVPYGTKSKETVVSFSLEIVRYLISKHIKILVIACNTASSLAIDEVRRKIKIPVIGVIQPGADAAIQLTKNRRILVIGTNATVSSMAYSRILRKKMKNARIVEKACPLFVPLVEEGWLEKKATRMIAHEYLNPLKKFGFDTLILGCTHYPLLKNVLKWIIGKHVVIIDSAESVAMEVFKNLVQKGMLNTTNTNYGYSRFIVSDDPLKFKKLAREILEIDVRNIEVKRF